MRKILVRVLAFSACFGLTALEVAPARAGSQVTYADDVAPIIYNNCSSCHRPGQIGPMSLLSFEEARPWAKSIAKVVAERSMPPWKGTSEHRKFKNDARLSEADIDTIVRWVKSGAKSGDLSKAPAPPTFVDGGWRIGTPDAIFTMEPYTISDDDEDVYIWRTIENHLTEDKWIKAIEIKSTYPQGTHHNLTFLVPKGEEGGNRNQVRDLFTGWAPGTDELFYTPGTGKLLPADHDILFQMHYHKEPGEGTGGTDQTSIAVLFADGPVEHPITTAWILDPTLDIPAGESNYRAESVFRFIDKGRIYSFTPHMHVRGKDISYIAEYPDGTKETLLEIPAWDFNWQINYKLTEPIEVPRGTKVRVVAHFDNSADNPWNPDPTTDVRWGEKTTDEMMIGFMDYIYLKRKKYQRTMALPEGIGDNFFGGEGRRRGRGGREGRRGRRGRGGSGEGRDAESSSNTSPHSEAGTAGGQ